MAVNLHFVSPYVSIVEWPSTHLPDFTLVTGLNGAGKTHLLQAVTSGCIQVEGYDHRKGEIRYFDWNGLTPNNEGVIDSAALITEQKGLVDAICNVADQHMLPVRSLIQKFNLPNTSWQDPRRIGKLTIEELRIWFPQLGRAEKIHGEIQTEFQQRSEQVAEYFRQHQPPAWSLVLEIMKTSLDPLISLSREEMMRVLPARWGTVGLFQQSFARLFVTYRDTQIANRIEQAAKANGEPTAKPLTDEEFVQKFHIPPWEFVNRIFDRAGLDFEVRPPDLFRPLPYQLQLRKKSTNQEVDISALSSGEKVLMGFANCLYYTNDKRQKASFPGLLLLDEIDAPLHPSMARQILNVITETLVREAGVKVIATTHSPATVALAPEESLYVMVAGTPGLQKTSKNQALNILLRDVPTLGLNFSGRRQVFVESERDANLYSNIYQLLKPRMNSERSLAFVSAGSTRGGSDHDGGSAQVRRVVSVLEDAQNHSVFGILDWDGTNTPTKRIRVLAVEERDGLENCIFDPLCLAITITRDAHDRRPMIGLDSGTSVFEFKSFTPDRLQQIVDNVQDLVIGPVTGKTTLTECHYVDGLRLQLRSDYLKCDDHQLESRILELFPPLGRAASRGSLKNHVVSNVFAEFPEFVPRCFQHVFEEILTAEV